MEGKKMEGLRMGLKAVKLSMRKAYIFDTQEDYE